MARPRKTPAFLVEATVRRNAKLALLPSDGARLGFFYVVLAESKVADPPGQFASREHFREVAGRFARYIDNYLAVGVLEVAPRLCAKCAPKWSSMPPRRGALVVHDWHDHQYDPRRLERQQAYDERQRGVDNDDVSDDVSDAQSDGVSDGVSDEVSDAISHARVAAARRDRVGAGASNVERRTESGSLLSSDPIARTREEPDAQGEVTADLFGPTTTPSERTNGRKKDAYAGAHGMSRAGDVQLPRGLRR